MECFIKTFVQKGKKIFHFNNHCNTSVAYLAGSKNASKARMKNPQGLAGFQEICKEQVVVVIQYFLQGINKRKVRFLRQKSDNPAPRQFNHGNYSFLENNKNTHKMKKNTTASGSHYEYHSGTDPLLIHENW